jgi:hypothetical protein
MRAILQVSTQKGTKFMGGNAWLSHVCPTVEITDQEVRIGEAGNLVKLTLTEWNILVQAIKAGELAEL